MAQVYRWRDKQPVVWWHDTLQKSNQECLYCARFIGDGSVPSNKEHLIGRDFGPAGCFKTGQEFNFIFRGCCWCNGEKADVERHLSTVTLFNSPARELDQNVDASARNKAAKDFHPTERKPVQDAITEFSAVGRGDGFEMNFGLVAPPQPEPAYVKFLAFGHIQGLFSLATTEDPTIRNTTRFLPLDHFKFFGYFPHGDWGNPQLREIYRRASVIPLRSITETAGGFFKAIMRRVDGPCGEWFWALEWNRSLRVFGGITDRNPPLVFDDLPPMKRLQVDDDAWIRPDVALASEDDVLFVE